MDFKRDWAFPFCVTAWLLTMHAGASDDASREKKFELLYRAPIRALAPPSPRFDPDQQHQQFLTDGVLVDVRTSVIAGTGVRRRIVQGSARNTGKTLYPRAVLELMEAPVAGRTASGQLQPGTFQTVASQYLGDLAAGRVTAVSLPFERPHTLLRLYQLRVRTLP